MTLIYEPADHRNYLKTPADQENEEAAFFVSAELRRLEKAAGFFIDTCAEHSALRLPVDKDALVAGLVALIREQAGEIMCGGVWELL